MRILPPGVARHRDCIRDGRHKAAHGTGERPGLGSTPIPAEAITQPRWIEGGPPGNVHLEADRHMYIVDGD
ncbi:MAG TPA: hypothetical protein VLT62_08550, partial [Candidatus Methylomirabilis sp.]|nr:hypothetical protein [Candidatus Methylomirabilis sp.]